MEQCPDVLKNLKKGDKIIVYDAKNGNVVLGRFTFEHFSMDCGTKSIECLSDNAGSIGENCFATLANVIIKLAGCDHNWKRVDLFRTTEFHCTKCPCVRPFDIEKDEAA